MWKDKLVEVLVGDLRRDFHHRLKQFSEVSAQNLFLKKILIDFKFQ